MAKTPVPTFFGLTWMSVLRRDLGTLLFHFTRSSATQSASQVLWQILGSRKLKGGSDWSSSGQPCISFTEAPIQEFAALFTAARLADIDTSGFRYEPYGVAVTREWLFAQGGRPVIYDHPDEEQQCAAPGQEYRFVPFDPSANVDFTWEREWRIQTECLELDPRSAFAVVPTAEEAFDILQEFASKPPVGEGGTTSECLDYMFKPRPDWLAVSLDLFGLRSPS